MSSIKSHTHKLKNERNQCKICAVVSVIYIHAIKKERKSNREVIRSLQKIATNVIQLIHLELSEIQIKMVIGFENGLQTSLGFEN